MKLKNIITVLLLSFIVVSCAAAPKDVATSTSIPTATLTTAPTKVPPTPTETPDPNAPEGWTGKDSKGNYVQVVSKNGIDFTYTYDQLTGKFTREVGELYLGDFPAINYLPYRVLINSDTQGAQNLVSLSHKDFTMVDFGSNSSYNPNPLTSVFMAELEGRLGIPDFRGAQHQSFINEMMKGKNSSAKFPFISSSGEALDGRLSTETGFILDIVNPLDMAPFVGNGVSKWEDPYGNIYYSDVTGVDADGSILMRIAIDGDLSMLPDKRLRWLLFSGVGNLITRKDQREQSFTTLTDIFAQYSARVNPNSKSGLLDVVIVRNP